MSQMFDGATIFNQPINTNGSEIGAWNTSSVTNMYWMFRDARNFNQNIGGWNTSRVTDMQHMFEGATSFNNGHWSPIFGFDGFLSEQESRNFLVSAGSISASPTVRRPNFRQTMNWNTHAVTNMNFMFHNTTNFINVDLGEWDVARAISNTVGFRRNSSMLSQFTPRAIIDAFGHLFGGR